MKRVRIPGTDLDVSALCYGLASFGTSVRGEAADRLYAAYREAGGCFFDTAHCYSFWAEGGLGASERALGDCLRRHADRSQVVVATKGGHPDGGPGYRRPDHYLAPEVIASDVAESLDRLGVDRIDLYYLHRDDPRVPVGEVLDALNAEIASGRVRHLGASNWSVARIAEANGYATAHGLRGFVASQPQWSLAHPNAEPPKADPAMRFLMDEDVHWHATQQIAVVPYSSTARGYFATDGEAARDAYDNSVSRARLERAQQLASRLGCTPGQVALAYLMCQSFPVIPVLGTLKVPHLEEDLAAGCVRLTLEQVRWLREGEAST